MLEYAGRDGVISLLRMTITTLLVLSFPALGACGNTSGGSGAAGYPGRDIEFVVPYEPGGGYDAWARLAEPYLEKHLPEGTNVVVTNQPGAGGLTAANGLYAAEPDGYEIQIMNLGGLAAGTLMDEQEFDLREFTYLAQITRQANVVCVAGDSEIDAIEDLQEAAPVQQAMVGMSTSESLNTVIVYDALDIEYEPVVHPGGGQHRISVIRGDTDAVVGSIESVLDYLKSGELKPILITSTNKPGEGEPGYEEVKDVPTIADTGHPEFEGNLDAMYTVAAPPGLPNDVKQVLDQAFQDALNDPEFVAEAAESERTPAPLNAAGAEQSVNDALDTLESYREVLIEANEKMN